MEENRLIVKGIKCNKCGDVIYSRSRHDFHWCSCKSCAIDGGFDYLKIVGQPNDWQSIDVTVLPLESEDNIKKILFDDWNKGTDKYGVIHETRN